jgi:hypothetical protein
MISAEIEIEIPIEAVPKKQEKTDLISSVTNSFQESGVNSVSVKKTHYNEKHAAGLLTVIVLVIEVVGGSLEIGNGIQKLFKKHPDQKTRIKIGDNSLSIDNSKLSSDEIIKIIDKLKDSKEAKNEKKEN